MIGNENIEKKQLEKGGLHLNGFAQNLRAGIRELCTAEKSFCDDISQKTNLLKECKLYHDSGISTTETNTFSEDQYLSCTSSEQKNDCYYKKAKIKLDIDGLIKVRNSYTNNPIIGYLNINTLQNKIISLREIIAKVPLDVFCVDETKLDDSFPDSQFILENFQFAPFRWDQNSKGGGKLVYIKQGIIAKRLENFETKFSETICIELTISKKNGVLYLQNKTLFFEEISSSLSHIVNKYDNHIIAGDPNINILDPKCDENSHFSGLKDTYNLSNLLRLATCFKSSKGTLLDVLLNNKPKSFQKTFVCETGLSDCHKLVATIFRLTLIKLPPKVVKYRSYKNLDENKFCRDLDQILIKGLYKVKDPYNKLTNRLCNTLEKHASSKSETVRRNQATFMNKELSKAIMEKSRLQNRHLKYPSRENFLAYKNIKNKCNNLLKQSKKKYIKDISNKGAATNK